MSNKWTTLVEEQHHETKKNITDILDDQNQLQHSSKKNKYIAIAMAAVGIFLIILGIYPFLTQSGNAPASKLRADVTDDGISTSDTNSDTEEVDSVPLLSEDEEGISFSTEETDEVLADADAVYEVDPTLVDPALMEELDSVDIDSMLPIEETESVDFVETVDETIPTDTDDAIEAEDVDVVDEVVPIEDVDAATEDLPVEEVDVVADDTSGEEDLHAAADEDGGSEEIANDEFPLNMHTGLTDATTVVYGADDAVHGAAEDKEAIAKSGPETWIAVFIALGVAFIVRRKKIFSA